MIIAQRKIGTFLLKIVQSLPTRLSLKWAVDIIGQQSVPSHLQRSASLEFGVQSQHSRGTKELSKKSLHNKTSLEEYKLQL